VLRCLTHSSTSCDENLSHVACGYVSIAVIKAQIIIQGKKGGGGVGSIYHDTGDSRDFFLVDFVVGTLKNQKILKKTY